MVDTLTQTPDNDSDTDDSGQNDEPKFELPSVANVQCGRSILERMICAIDFLEACDVATIQEVIFVGISNSSSLPLSRIAALRTTFWLTLVS